MPSSSEQNGYPSASSSTRHPEHRSSHSSAYRRDRSPGDKHRRPYSPEARHQSGLRYNDRRTSSDLRRRDDNWSVPHAYDVRYDDDRHYSRADSRNHYGSYPSRAVDSRDRYDSEASRSSRPPRQESRQRSPSPSSSWDYDHSRGWDADLDRGSHWKHRDDEERRRSGDLGPKQAYVGWNSRSPPRPSRPYRDHRADGSRHDDDSERDRRRREDDDRRSRRHVRSRSRSRSRSRERNSDRRSERSRDRPREADSKQDFRIISAKTLTQSKDDDNRGNRSAQLNGHSEESKLLKRKSQPEAPTSSHSLPDTPPSASADTTSAADDDHRRDEHQSSTIARSNHDRLSSRPARPHGDDTAPRISSARNGSATPSSRSDAAPVNGSERHGWRSISGKEAGTETQTKFLDQQVSDTSEKNVPKSNGTDPFQPRTQKAATIERTFGRVQLPHELPKELRGKNYLATSAYKEDTRPVFKSAAEKHLVDATTTDPRRDSKKRMQPRTALYPVKFRWDGNSVGNKPLPPPRTIVLTNLAPRVPPQLILPILARFGRVESSKLEVHPTIGQSLGIFSATYAHDLDENGKPLQSVASDKKPQNGALAAKEASLNLQGCTIGPTSVCTFLDRDGKLAAEKVKERLAEEEKQRRSVGPVPAPAPASAVRVNSSPATPIGPKSSMPPPGVPRGPRASMAAAASPSLTPSSPAVRAVTRGYERSSSTQPRYGSSHDEGRRAGYPDTYNRRRGMDEHDSARNRHYSDREPERKTRPPPPARSETRKQSSEEILKELRDAQHAYVFIPRPKNCDVDLEAVKLQLASTDPIWVKEGDAAFYAAFYTTTEANKCKLVNEVLSIGSYTLQVDARRAPPLQTGPDQNASAGRAPGRAPLPNHVPAVQPRKTIDTGLRPLSTEEKNKTDWTAAELQEAVFRMLQKELADTFVRDVKSRVVGPHLTSYLKADGEGRQLLVKAIPAKNVVPLGLTDRAKATSEANGDARLPSFRKLAGAKPKKVSEGDKVVSKKMKDATGAKREHDTTHKSRSHRSKDVFSSDDESDHSRRVSKATTRRDSGARSKSGTRKRGAAAWLLDSGDEEADPDEEAATHDASSRSVSASVEPLAAEQFEEHEAGRAKKGSRAKAASADTKKGVSAKKGTLKQRGETATPETDTTVKAGKPKTKTAKASAKAKPIPADPFEAGLVEDGEDCHYLRLALEHLHQTGELASEDTLPDEVELDAEAEEQAIATGAIPKHSTGSARTEGYYRIPPAQKAMHLPDRNKATEDVDSSGNAQVLQSARNNRADSRRLVLGIEQHKRETATDTDMFKFNQLRTRKKQLKFAKSPIHDWGLYAMEFIPAGDMVIEYVGEVVRQQVADEREKQYERQGNFSTYLFRVDDDLVVDATHKGNIARLMNHCCTPNCNAKILTLNGEKRIVLFAKSPIRAGEELTYDYKFQSSADDEDAIPCLCGSPGCRRFL